MTDRRAVELSPTWDPETSDPLLAPDESVMTDHGRMPVGTADAADREQIPPACLVQAWELSEPLLRECTATLHPTLAVITGYHLGWCDALGEPCQARGGKGVCLALAMVASQAVGAPASSAVFGAVSTELTHICTHMHDDVMDSDMRRRGRDSIWKVFGIGPAILTGDALLALALRVLADAPSSRRMVAVARLIDVYSRLAEGQAQDLAFERAPLTGPQSIDVQQYLTMAANKTGSLYAGAMAIGAILGGADDDTVAVLDSAGRHLGLVAQMVDDVNGIWGDPSITGKPVFSDLRNRKKSLPVVSALSSGHARSVQLAELLTAEPGAHDDLPLIAELVAAAGGLAFTSAESDRQYRLVFEDLNRLPIPGRIRADIDELADFIHHRRA